MHEQECLANAAIKNQESLWAVCMLELFLEIFFYYNQPLARQAENQSTTLIETNKMAA